MRVAGFFQTFDTHGYPKTTEIGTSSTNHTRRVILDYDFNPATLNLLSRTKRTDNGSTTVASETFTYDPLDRLTGWDVTVGSQTQNYHLNYANNGNITQKSDMGVYQYYSDKPNAVTNVSNLSGSRVNTYENNIQYTPFNKVSSINIMQSGYEFGLYTMTYGPDDQRRKSNHYDYVDNIFTHTIYSGLYEERSTGEQLHYIPTPAGIGAVLVTHKNIPSQKDFYYLYNDHLGSLIAATKRGSTVLQEFSYDPWGRRRDAHNWNNYEVTEPTLFTRGFTGHEHIGGYGLINMNGRVYDARLGRFLSPDPYVQAPDYSQSFNRYSYGWNNPLKYTDPDGEWIWLAPVIVGAIIGGYSGYKIGKSKGATGWGMAGYIFGGAAIGGIAGYTGFSLFNSGMAAGTAAGMGGISAGFNAGLLSGMASGAITGGGMTALGGGSFIDVLNGATIGAWMGGVAGGLSGAIAGGFHNMKNGLNFWGNKLSKFSGNDLAYGYLVGGDGSITRMPGIQGDLGGANTHFFWTGNWDATRTAFLGERLPIIVDGLNTINAFRFWQSATSTISSFIVPATGLTGYFLEPKGPSTTKRDQNKRVPAGSFRLIPNTNKYPNDFMIYNNLVHQNRGITIHSGNIPAHTRGCLLPGMSWSTNKVSSSKDMRDLLRLYINQSGYRNIRFNIFDNF